MNRRAYRITLASGAVRLQGESICLLWRKRCRVWSEQALGLRAFYTIQRRHLFDFCKDLLSECCWLKNLNAGALTQNPKSQPLAQMQFATQVPAFRVVGL